MTFSVNDMAAVGAVACAATVIGGLLGGLAGAALMRFARPEATDPAGWADPARCLHCTRAVPRPWLTLCDRCAGAAMEDAPRGEDSH